MVLESTTYPGTTEELVAPLLEEGSGLAAGADFHLGYSPERIDPGNHDLDAREHAEGRVRHRRRLAGRGAGRSTTRSSTRTVPVSLARARPSSTKLLENTFRHVNIALVNELAMFARDLGIDVWEAIDAASTKPFGFMRFTPGPGSAATACPSTRPTCRGGCAGRSGQRFRFVELANDVNDHMPDYVVRRAGGRAQPARPGRSTGAASCCSGWPTSATPATPGSRRPRRVADQLRRLGAEVAGRRSARPASPFLDERVARVDATPEELAAADAVRAAHRPRRLRL